MLWYIIDGWNVIHKMPLLKNSPSAREDFIYFLKRYRITGSRNNRVTIVFDGRIDLNLKESERQFEIVFGGTKSADEIICNRVSAYSNKRNIIVVSDDNEIINYIKAQGASSVRTKEFLSRKDKKSPKKNSKEISYAVKKEITDELRKFWLKE